MSQNRRGQTQALSADQQLSNLMALMGFRTYVELAAWMGLADDSNLHNWRKRGRGMIPQDVVVSLAEKYGLSTDWMIFGQGPAWRKDALEQELTISDNEAAALARLIAFPQAKVSEILNIAASLTEADLAIIASLMNHIATTRPSARDEEALQPLRALSPALKSIVHELNRLTPEDVEFVRAFISRLKPPEENRSEKSD